MEREVGDYKKGLTRKKPFHPKRRIHPKPQTQVKAGRFFKCKMVVRGNITFRFNTKQQNSLFLARASTVNPLAPSYACIFARSVGTCDSGTLALMQFLLMSGLWALGWVCMSSLRLYLFICACVCSGTCTALRTKTLHDSAFNMQSEDIFAGPLNFQGELEGSSLVSRLVR